MHLGIKWLAAIALAGFPLTNSGTGFRLPDHDAFATARGEAFAATADNAAAVYYNPAGITQLQGVNFRGGIYGINLNLSYESPTGRDLSSQKENHALPQFFVTYTPTNFPISFGFGVYSPYGLASSWPNDSGFRTVAMDAVLNYVTFNPVLAWKVTDTLSVGAGARFNYSRVDLRQGLLWPAQPWDEFRFEGDGWDIGYNLGALWKAHEKLSFGVSFRSPTRIKYDGHSSAHNEVPLPVAPQFTIPPFRYRSDARADVPFPMSVVAGVSYRPTERWNLEFNADYMGWNRINSLVIEQATTIPPIPANPSTPLHWDDSWFYELGVTHYFPNGWTLSGGYIFAENSVPDEFFTPLVPDQDRHFFSAGTGYRGEHFNFDFAYQFGYGPDRTISAPILPNGNSVAGDYGFQSHAIILSAGWNF